MTDTIAAIATPPGTGAIATIRISGPRAIDIVQKLWSGAPLHTAKSHTAHLGTISHPDGTQIDQTLATIFRAPNSYTGEDTIEISCHGSTYIQQNILNALILAGAKMAGPGQFSQQAFLNHKIDLAQAEGIADLIAAQSQAAHRLALQQTKGKFSQQLETLRQNLIQLASLLELELDFSEEDVTFADRETLLRLSQNTLDTIQSLADTYAQGQAIRNGHPTTIAGAPNAGKSTLINALAGDPIAIVSQIPGTTRDAIQTTITIGGHLIRITDTAGLRNTTDTIENLGIQLAHRHIRQASTLIYLIDPTAPLTPQTDQLTATLKDLTPLPHLIIAISKTDLLTADTDADDNEADDNAPGAKDIAATTARLADDTDAADDVPGAKDIAATTARLAAIYPHAEILKISAKTPDGTAPLTQAIRRHLDATPAPDIAVTNARHYQALTETAQALTRLNDGLTAGLTADILALDLRQALHTLGTITGAITTDTLLHTIFSRFCIGK